MNKLARSDSIYKIYIHSHSHPWWNKIEPDLVSKTYHSLENHHWITPYQKAKRTVRRCMIANLLNAFPIPSSDFRILRSDRLRQIRDAARFVAFKREYRPRLRANPWSRGRRVNGRKRSEKRWKKLERTNRMGQRERRRRLEAGITGAGRAGGTAAKGNRLFAEYRVSYRSARLLEINSDHCEDYPETLHYPRQRDGTPSTSLSDGNASQHPPSITLSCRHDGNRGTPRIEGSTDWREINQDPLGI